MNPDATPACILIVEDEAEMRALLRAALAAEGFEVVEADGVHRGDVEARARRPDLALIDLGLPDGSGIELIRLLRSWSSLPIVVLSARSQELDKIAALDAGADDFVTKPFSIAELLARLRAHLRRTGQPVAETGTVRRYGDLEFDPGSRTLSRAGVALKLTRIEYKLFATLADQPGRVLTHRQLLREVWGPSHVEDTHYVRVYVGHLRNKIESDPSRPRHLVTELGVGYRFMP